MPSLTHGGALWFSDLTIADPTYALPVLCSAMLLITVEVGAADGMQGQDPSMLRNMKNVMRAVSVILVPVTAGMPQARPSGGHSAPHCFGGLLEGSVPLCGGRGMGSRQHAGLAACPDTAASVAC